MSPSPTRILDETDHYILVKKHRPLKNMQEAEELFVKAGVVVLSSTYIVYLDMFHIIFAKQLRFDKEQFVRILDIDETPEVVDQEEGQEPRQSTRADTIFTAVCMFSIVVSIWALAIAILK